MANDDDTARPFIRLSTIVPAAVIGAFQHQMHIEGIRPVTAESTDKAILALLEAYGEGRIAIVPPHKDKKKIAANEYVESHK